ncbi:MAG: hypothetical protein AB1393_05865 [Candidatus Edwardsbacteria bacterium]
MGVYFHSHALERMEERGATENEVIITVEKGEHFGAKFGRTGFRHNFPFEGEWRGKYYHTKQIETYAIREKSVNWLVLTVITRYF